MEMYVETKFIMAEPMTAKAFNEKVRPLVYSGECQDGYLVVYEDSYQSWSPKEVFEKTYEEANRMTFGNALETVKRGIPIAREGWNGKGMFVVYQKGYPNGIPCNVQTAKAWGLKEGALFKCNPYLQIKCVDGSHSMWVPSINDILAEDWHGIILA